jgi:hypothetical protein
MSTGETLSEQEQKAAEELRQILDGLAPESISRPFEGATRSLEQREFVELAMLGKLTQISVQEWSPRNDATLRHDVVSMAIKRAQNAAVTRPSLLSRRFVTWLGLAVPGALALFFALHTETPPSEQEASRAIVADFQKEESLPSAAPAQRLSEESRLEDSSGELPSQLALLRAQAEALAERSRLTASAQKTDVALDQAWRDYRGHLIAGLEQP